MRVILAALAALLFLSACGKKAPLRPPSSDPAKEEPVDG
jgi:predicted small lipoprotein YifL